MHARRYKLRDTAVRLRDGRVLEAGGGPLAELFDPSTHAFTPSAEAYGGKFSFASAAPLDDGGALIVGGYDDAMRNTDGIWRFRP